MMFPVPPREFPNEMPPCVLVIFGATGDLTARKLLPALYNLSRENQLPDRFACVGYARRPKDHDVFRSEMQEAVSMYGNHRELDVHAWERLQKRLFYHQGFFNEDKDYISLKDFLHQLDSEFFTEGNRLFYLSTPPSNFQEIIKQLRSHELFIPHKEPSSCCSKKSSWTRVIIEKPFGHDLESAKELQKCIDDNLCETCVYRIDHYLGKETVQNIQSIRFANKIFESCWAKECIDNVQITVSESIGIGSRGNFFEQSGMLRDMVQNHMMQLLCLLTMEPPTSFSSESIKKEKIRVLNNVVPFSEIQSPTYPVVRGQYGPGKVGGVSVKGYRQEDLVAPDSLVETYVALKMLIDTPRWQGVPFYLRAGKRLEKRCTEIAITFKKPIHGDFFSKEKLENDLLIIRIQPDEGVALKFNCKVPGVSNLVKPVKMDFRYDSYFKTQAPEAYERLLCDCILGDRTLFTGNDEVIASWELFTPLLEKWRNDPSDALFPNYVAGSSGPQCADALMHADGRSWRVL
ncbi:glucose-6-phosphate dehydrogenase [Chlamydiifrater phoenicopteri]|uniref:glucose-6-phosphate dehydrogenase n=1 Tax=Chlamydiifrater phoenicopteri TaxID=2681469 RepID=UPI001BCBFD39|nr:glucose-6-phosphate dehydrogenase [Chlamydiifrater phoenicopteri]